MASKFFFKPFVTVPVAPIITGIIIRLMFHIRHMSIHKLLYFRRSSASFCLMFLSAAVTTSVSKHVFSFFFSYYIWPIYHNFVIIIIIIIIIISVCCVLLLQMYFFDEFVVCMFSLMYHV
jgi:hypothetical protein